ncbi:MAG: dockerin type I repeat-containing protein [Fimbriimonadales bacterium]|nr:dockerin type I repeat-containing protein [Fimbriimonadales bacterium]
MKRAYWWLGVSLGALLVATAPAQIVYSFEPEDLHGFANNVPAGWQVFRATLGVTHGQYSMGVSMPANDFQWLGSNGVRDELLPYLQVSKKLLLDVTVAPGRSVPWANMIVSLNDPQLEWRQTRFSFGLPRTSAQSATRTVLLDLEELPLPDPNVAWFQINFGMNAGAAHELYFDNLRLYRPACEMLAFTFDNDLQGFRITDSEGNPQPGITLSWVAGQMRVSNLGGFKWLFNGGGDGSVPNLAAMVRRADLVVMDVTVISPPPAGWGNMIVSINSPAGWGQTNYVAEIALGQNTFTRTVAVDYRGVALPNTDTPDYCLLNIGINSGGPMTIAIDNIRFYRRAIVGDVNCDGCVNDIDLLQVLLEFGNTTITPADVNNDGVVNDIDLLAILLNFGSGC